MKSLFYFKLVMIDYSEHVGLEFLNIKTVSYKYYLLFVIIKSGKRLLLQSFFFLLRLSNKNQFWIIYCSLPLIMIDSSNTKFIEVGLTSDYSSLISDSIYFIEIFDKFCAESSHIEYYLSLMTSLSAIFFVSSPSTSGYFWSLSLHLTL